MTGRAKALLLSIVLILSSGCAGRPVLTVEVLRTPTPTGVDMAVPTAVPDLPSATPVPPLPEFSPEVVALPPDFSPILYGEKYDANMFFILLGGVQAGEWVTLDQAAASLRGVREYDVYPLEAENFQVQGYSPEFSPPHEAYFIGTDVTVDETGMVGVAHGWPVRQVKPQELVAENEIYQQVVLDWLKTAGIKEPKLGSLQIFRVDLEGDGVDEIFLSATHLDDSQHTTRSGDYSIVLMRKLVGNEVVTLPIVMDVYHPQEAETTFPRAYTLANFIDLNKDGVLEVVVDFQRWEADGALIYQIDGQRVIEVP